MIAKLFTFFAFSLVACSESPIGHVTAPVVAPTEEVTRIGKGTPGSTPSRVNEDSKKLQCGDIEFELNKISVSPDNRWDIEIVGKGSRVTLPTPSFDEYQNLGVLSAVQNDGFSISVDWGTRIYHDMRFTFTCGTSGFSLVRIDHDTFDKHFPEDASKYRQRVRKVVPNIPIEKFVLRDFMVD